MDEMKLYDIDSGELGELIDSKRAELKNKNEEYKKLKLEVEELLEKYPNIKAIIENEDVEFLSADDCKTLQKLINLNIRMAMYEDREIFFLGARENYFYFKNLNLIKE